MKFNQKIQSRLIILNTCLLVLLILAMLVGGSLFKDLMSNPTVRNFASKEIDKALIRLEGLTPADEEDIKKYPHYQLEIKPEIMRAIEVQIGQILKRYTSSPRLQDEDKVWYSAKFHENNEIYKVKIRIRGDVASHWDGPKKSWRVKFDKSKLFHGMREIDLIIPLDKPYDYLASEFSQKLGLISVPSGFCTLKVNSQFMGAYFWMEKLTPELIERIKYPPGEIFRENNTWTETRHTGYGSYYYPYYGHKATAEGDHFGLPYYPENFTVTLNKASYMQGYHANRWHEFLKLVKNSDREYFKDNVERYVNMDKYLTWNALTWLFGSEHSRWGDNMRWYLNSSTGLLEPILYDIAPSKISNQRSGTFEFGGHDRLSKRVLQFPEYRQQRNEILYKILKNPELDPISLHETHFSNIFKLLISGLGADSSSDVATQHIKSQEILKYNIENIKGNLEFARIYLTPKANLYKDSSKLVFELLPDSLSDLKLSSLTLQLPDKLDIIGSIKDIKVFDYLGNEVKGLRKEVFYNHGFSIHFHNLNVFNPLDSALRPYPAKWRLQVTFKDDTIKRYIKEHYSSLKFSAKVMNLVSKEDLDAQQIHFYPLSVALENPKEYNVSIDEIIRKAKIPWKVIGKQLILTEGEYNLSETLVLPRDFSLLIKEGVNLTLSPGVSLVLYQKLQIEGSKEKPVVISAFEEDKPWGSIAVINAEEKSNINFLELKGGSESLVNGGFYSGQICFYYSDVNLKNCLIEDAKADDGLNIKHAEFYISECTFRHNSADAFDGDWVKGKIEASIFDNNYGDGIDFSGAQVIARNNLFFGTTDKACSIGENTLFISDNNSISKSGIGIAVKELSQALVVNTSFYENGVDFSLYQKKEIFGGGTAYVRNCILYSPKIAENDKKSKIIFRNCAMNINVDKSNLILEECFEIDFKDIFIYKHNKLVYKNKSIPQDFMYSLGTQFPSVFDVFSFKGTQQKTPLGYYEK